MTSKYKNGKIYRIVSDSANLEWFGSTVQPLNVRMASHRRYLKKFQDGKGEKMPYCDILMQADAKIILVENFPCETKEELSKREQYWAAISAQERKHIKTPDELNVNGLLAIAQLRRKNMLSNIKPFLSSNDLGDDIYLSNLLAEFVFNTITSHNELAVMKMLYDNRVKNVKTQKNIDQCMTTSKKSDQYGYTPKFS